MRRSLALSGLFAVLISTSAQAQMRDIFGTSPAISARSAWDQLPSPLLSCIDDTLQQQGTSVNNLVRQNTYPNSPQYRAVIDSCQRGLRPKIETASEAVKRPEWQTFSPEKRLAYFIETFWVDHHLTYFKCGLEMRAKSYFEQKACLARNGFWFESSSPQKCTLKIMERVPERSEPTKSWDGKVTSVDIVGRELTMRLMGLDEQLIRTNSSSFDLYFELAQNSPTRRTAYSNAPEEWVDVPPPPLISDFVRAEADKSPNGISRARMAWSMEVARTASADTWGFSIAPYSYQPDTNSEAGMQRLRDNETRTFLKLSTPYFSNAFFHGDDASIMTNAFIETVKAVLSECRK
jgi:hypothetical protein